MTTNMEMASPKGDLELWKLMIRFFPAGRIPMCRAQELLAFPGELRVELEKFFQAIPVEEVPALMPDNLKES